MSSWSELAVAPGPLRPVRLWIDRHPAISALALGCLLALILSALPGSTPRACPNSHGGYPPAAAAAASRPAAKPQG